MRAEERPQTPQTAIRHIVGRSRRKRYWTSRRVACPALASSCREFTPGAAGRRKRRARAGASLCGSGAGTASRRRSAAWRGTGCRKPSPPNGRRTRPSCRELPEDPPKPVSAALQQSREGIRNLRARGSKRPTIGRVENKAALAFRRARQALSQHECAVNLGRRRCSGGEGLPGPGCLLNKRMPSCTLASNDKSNENMTRIDRPRWQTPAAYDSPGVRGKPAGSGAAGAG